MLTAAVELPNDRIGVVGAVGDDDDRGTVAEWLGGDRSEHQQEEEEEEEEEDAGALEVALGEAAQRAMEAFYGDGGGARGDPPDAVLVPHALPDAPGSSRERRRRRPAVREATPGHPSTRRAGVGGRRGRRGRSVTGRTSPRASPPRWPRSPRPTPPKPRVAPLARRRRPPPSPTSSASPGVRFGPSRASTCPISPARPRRLRL